ncbi:MAG: hypothetical protein ACTSRA_07155 [Promethearchaeota archaeon]
MTALGPALLAGVYIYTIRELRGRILLLTDGLANVSLGRLEYNIGENARNFYDRLAKICLQNDIVVDVIGVGGENELALDILGKLSELTGDELYFVSQDELDWIFGEMEAWKFVGRNVNVRVFTPPSIDVGESIGISEIAKQAKRFEKIPVGSVTSDREALIKFDIKKRIKEETPIQVQVEFFDKKGNKRLRVFETKLKPEENEDEYKKSYDARLLSILNIQQAGAAFSKGESEEARNILAQTMDLFSKSEIQSNISTASLKESLDF